MLLYSLLADHRDCFVWRKIVPVIGEDEEVEGENQAVGGAAGSHIDLMIFQRRGQQAEIHDAWRRPKVKTIGGSQSSVTLGTLHDLISDTGRPLGSEPRGLR